MREPQDLEKQPFFSQPVRQILLMLIVLGLVGFGAYVAYPRVAPVFLSNPWLNGIIVFVFVIGVFACFWQVVQLITSVSWIEGFAAETPGHELTKAPLLLAPLAALLRGRGRRMQINAASAASIQDSVATRIDEARDITRYIVNLLIFLGLLGTFWGLATTVPAVVDTIRSLEPQEGEGGIEVFGRLMNGLEAQLGGMGTAFASSLLGLAGSLVVGLLELFASHGQNRFYRELEDWLSTITRLGLAGTDADGDGGVDGGQAVYLFDQLARQLEDMQSVFGKSEESRSRLEAQLGALAGSIDALVSGDRAGADTSAVPGATEQTVKRIADGQADLVNAIGILRSEGGGNVDAESRMRLRSIDVQLLRILEELTAGRQESVADLRGEITELTRAVRALAPRGRG